MFFSWLDAREAKEFGIALARFYMDHLPLDPSVKQKRGSEEVVSILNKMARLISAFKQKRKLNFYKKAQLGNAFSWALADAGYDKETVDDLTRLLLLRL
jgi:hypothetical protein